MKFTNILPLLLLSFFLKGCLGTGTEDDTFTTIPNNYLAVKVSREQLEGSVELKAPQPVLKSGKIYIKGDLMFITEVNAGFHVFNYADPANPVAMAYIKIPGATDLAVRNNNLYINQAVDLVTLNYANNTLTETGRRRNVFPQKLSPEGQYEEVGNNEVIIDWTPR